MTDEPNIVGRKSSKGGGEPVPSDPNTLRSRTRVKIIDAISEGEISGLVDGLKSVYLNGTPIQNADLSLNFNNVIFQGRNGLPDDAPLNNFDGVENIVSVETKVAVSTGAVTRTLTEPTADLVKVIMRINSLFKVDDESGAVKVNSVRYQIDVRPAGGAWVTYIDNNIVNEKCVSPTQMSHPIYLPTGGSPWDIRVRRITPDSTNDKDQNEIYFESYVVVVKGKFTYPYTACMGIEMNAEDLGSTIPERLYHVRGRKIRVPINYDPTTAVYSGVWNGTFKIEYSNNPAWVFYDMIRNNVYGIGDLVDASKIDKWKLYTIAQYCDELVPDGYGGQERRYTFNGVIKDGEEAFFALQKITQTWRGMAYWSQGQVFVTADIPDDADRLIGPANVIDGVFDYSSTSLKSRHSVVLVRYNDRNNFFKPAIEAVVDDDMIKIFGWRPKQVELIGCTSRSLARRYGKWIIDTEKNSTETVTFTAAWDQISALPGQIVAINDPRRANVRLSGRVKSHTGDSIYLDYDFEPTGGETYKVKYMTPAGEVLTYDVLQTYPGDKTRLRIGTPTAYADVNAMFVIVGVTTVQPRRYRIISIEESSEGLLNVTAVTHDTTKYARVEQNINFPSPPTTQVINRAKPPTNLTVREVSYVNLNTVKTRLNLSWSSPAGVAVARYQIVADTPLQKSRNIGFTSSTTIDIDVDDFGDYKFLVSTVDIFGSISLPAEVSYTVIGATLIDPGSVSNLVNAATNVGGTSAFSGRDVKIKWQNTFLVSSEPLAGTTPIADQHPNYLNNTVRVYAMPSNTLLRTETVLGTDFIYTYAMNTADCAAVAISNPSRSLRFDVTVTDRLGRTSSAATTTLTNAVPGGISPTLAVDGRKVNVTWPAQLDPDYAATSIWIETNNSFDPLVTTPKYTGNGNYYSFIGSTYTTYYVRIGSFDAFGTAGMIISAPFAISTLADFDTDAPATPTGLVLTSSIVNNEPVMVASWNANVEVDLAYYDVSVRENTGSPVAFQTSINLIEWVVNSGSTYNVSVRAVDGLGNTSAYSAEVAHVAATDSVPPAVPTGLVATGSFGSIWLKWDANTEKDLLGYEIYESTTTTAPTGGTAATFFSQATTLNRGALGDVAITRHYWIRSVDTSGNRSVWTSRVQATTTVIDTTVVTADLIGLIDATSFASSIKPIEVVATLPIAPHVEGRQVFLTTDDKLYRNTGSGWTTAVDGGDIVANTITGGKIVAGAISTTQLAAKAVVASKLLVGDTSNVWLDYDMLDAALYASSTSAAFTLVSTTAGLAGLGQKYLSIPSGATAHSVETEWESCEPDADYFVEGKVWVGTAVASLSGTLAIQFATNNSGTPVLSRTVTVGTKAVVYSAATSRVISTALKTNNNEVFFRFVMTKTAFSGGTVNFGGIVMRRKSAGELIVDGAITSDKVTTGELLTLTAQIKDAIITDAKVANLSAAKLTAGSALAGSITVAGTALSTVSAAALDPITTVNSLATFINPGRILVSGATTLSDWRNGGDTTKIEGGAIAANTITANKITIGQRGLTISGIQFEANSPATDQISWSSGTIQYVNDAGTATTRTITASSATWTTGTLYLYWVKDATTISSTTTLATALGANNVVLASYSGGLGMIVSYGRTIIDGSFIKTGSIDAAQIKAGAIVAGKIAAGAIVAADIASNTITADKLTISSRGLNFYGIFVQDNNPSPNYVAWSAGSVQYLNDAGTAVTTNITANTTGVLWTGSRLYIYWVKGATTFSTTTSLSTAMGANNVIIATYDGGSILNVIYGATTIDGATIRTGTINASDIQAGLMESQYLNVTTLLSLGNIGAGFSLGKESNLDFSNDGLFMARTDEGGSTGFSFLMGRTALSTPEYIRHNTTDGLEIVNSKFKIGEAGTQTTATVTTSTTYDLPAGTKFVTIRAFGGGKGGSTTDGTTTVNGGNGGNTVIQLWDGLTNTGISWTASGATAQHTLTDGQATTAGVAGIKTSYTNAFTGLWQKLFDATAGAANSGSGGGAGGKIINSAAPLAADALRRGLGGKAAVELGVNRYDVSALTAPKLVITRGAGGAGATLAGADPGGAGASGRVVVISDTGSMVDANVIPIGPTAVGNFTKAANATGATIFPDLGPGMWFITSGSVSQLCLNTVAIGTADGGTTGLLLELVGVATFISKTRPDITVGNVNARTIYYRFYKME